MSNQTTVKRTIAGAQDRAAQRQATELQTALAQTLEREGYGFVSLDPDDAVEIIVARGMGSSRFAIGLVFQPLLHQFSMLLAYTIGRLGLDALILVAPDLASLEQLAALIGDQVPAECRGKVGVMTSAALESLFPKNFGSVRTVEPRRPG